MVEPKTQWQPLLDSAGKVVGLLLSMTILVYGVGWLYAKFYFQALGADWLTPFLPDRVLLTMSGAPLSIMGSMLFLLGLFLVKVEGEQESKIWSTTRAFVESPAKLVLAMLVFAGPLYLLHGYATVFLGIMTFLLGVSLAFILAYLMGRPFKNPVLQVSIILITFSVLFLVLYLVAGGKGTEDRDEKTSTLAKVGYKGESFRLLFMADGNLYLARFVGDKTLVIVVPMEEATSIEDAGKLPNAN